MSILFSIITDEQGKLVMQAAVDVTEYPPNRRYELTIAAAVKSSRVQHNNQRKFDILPEPVPEPEEPVPEPEEPVPEPEEPVSEPEEPVSEPEEPVSEPEEPDAIPRKGQDEAKNEAPVDPPERRWEHIAVGHVTDHMFKDTILTVTATVFDITPGQTSQLMERGKQEYTLFGAERSLTRPAIALQTSYTTDPATGKPVVTASAQATVQAKKGYEIAGFFEGGVTFSYSAAGEDPVDCAGEVEGNTIRFPQICLHHAGPGKGSYFILTIRYLVRDQAKGGYTYALKQVIDSREYLS